MVECKICNKKYKDMGSLARHISYIKGKKSHPNIKDYYLKYIGTQIYCYCGKETNLISIEKGYRKYCSSACVARCNKLKEKSKRTCLEKYGVEYSFQSKELRNKRRKTMLDKYGTEYALQVEEFKEKYRKTCFKKYGVEYVAQSKIMKEKSKQTMLKKYGVEHALQSEKFKEKSKQTMLEKHNVEHALQSDKFKEKSKQTCLEKYGVEYSFQSKEVQDKIKKTNLDRYGVEYYTQTQQYLEDVKNTCLKKYDAKNPMNVKKFKEKSIQSLHKKFFNRLLNSDRLKDLVTPLFNLNGFNGTSYKYLWKCTQCQINFEDNLINGKVPRCPTCYPPLTGTSIEEQEVLSFIQKYYPESKSDRIILEGKEIDIYIEELKLGIEYHGLYWHSELGNNTDPKYHQNKTLLAKSKGVHLIQIFEDEWMSKQDIVKSILLNKMGKSPNKVFARKCTIKEVDNKIAKQFLFDNHLQGEINGTHIGLFYKDQLVSLITMGKSRFNKSYDYEILRFCNKLNYSITGGLSKLLKHFKKDYSPSSIITYADARYGEGKGYENCGFKYKELTNPNYFYLKNNGRENRMKYQKHKLKDLLESFDSTLTEWQNMQLNGFDRIWDCGNYKYEIKIINKKGV